MVVDRFLISKQDILVPPNDYKSQTMERLTEGFALAKKNAVGDKVLLDVRVVLPGTSKKLNPIYQGPYRVLKVNSNHTVEIRSYDGSRIQVTHVNRLKPLLESMIWRDEECVDFNDLPSSRPSDVAIKKILLCLISQTNSFLSLNRS